VIHVGCVDGDLKLASAPSSRQLTGALLANLALCQLFVPHHDLLHKSASVLTAIVAEEPSARGIQSVFASVGGLAFATQPAVEEDFDVSSNRPAVLEWQD